MPKYKFDPRHAKDIHSAIIRLCGIDPMEFGFKLPSYVTRKMIMNASGVKEDSVKRAVRVFESDLQDIKRKMMNGIISIKKADSMLKLPALRKIAIELTANDFKCSAELLHQLMSTYGFDRDTIFNINTVLKDCKRYQMTNLGDMVLSGEIQPIPAKGRLTKLFDHLGIARRGAKGRSITAKQFLRYPDWKERMIKFDPELFYDINNTNVSPVFDDIETRCRRDLRNESEYDDDRYSDFNTKWMELSTSIENEYKQNLK